MRRTGYALCAALALFVSGASCDREQATRESTGLTRHPLATAATESSQEPQQQGAGPRVVFLGDSISAGLHLPEEQAFPAVLERRLVAAGTPFQLVNGGVSGDTTAGGLRRLDWLMKQGPAIVVVELGANDGLRGLPLASVEENLRNILLRIQERGALPLLLGMRLPPSYGANYTDAFAALYPKLARELDVAFVPYFMEGVAGVPDLNLEDGIHPTQAGHERLAANVADALTKLVVRANDADADAGRETH